MFSGLVNHIRLTVIAKTGYNPAAIALAVVALICLPMAFLLFVFTAFIWLANRYTPLTAALVLAVGFLLIAILAGVGALMIQRRTAERAKVALAARRTSPLLDPAMLTVALQIGRNIGLRRIVPLVAAGVLAAGFAREWLREPADEADEPAE
jgi:hypothetical protein